MMAVGSGKSLTDTDGRVKKIFRPLITAHGAGLAAWLIQFDDAAGSLKSKNGAGITPDIVSWLTGRKLND